MVKKIVLVFVMFASVFMASAQIAEKPPRFDTGVLSMNGSHWVSMTPSTKQSFAMGLFFGFDTLRQFISAMEGSASFREWLEEEYSDTEGIFEYMQMISNWAFYSGMTINDIVISIDKAYENTSNRKYSVLEILLVTYDKQWWALD